jgi:hypothetical protein
MSEFDVVDDGALFGGWDDSRLDRTGRRTKLTRARAIKIVQLIRMGNYAQIAAQACGITEKSYYDHLREGRKYVEQHGEDMDTWPEDSPELARRRGEFSVAINEAMAQAEAYAVGTIRAQMGDNWTAAMTFLERSRPGRWRRTDRHEVVTNPEDDGKHQDAALLEDPEAADLMHDALDVVAQRKQLPKPPDG